MSAVTINDVCRAAWEATRSSATVPYDELIDSYRAKLISRAKAVLAGEWPSGTWQAFETQVLQLADGRGNMQIGSDTESTEESDKPSPKKKTAKKGKK
jgi:hypothetical protein